MSRNAPTPALPTAEGIRVEPWTEAEAPTRILAIRLQALGDTVLTLPYLQALRRQLPTGSTLDFLTRKEVSDLPKHVTLFDKVFEIGGGRTTRMQYLSALSLLPRLRRRRYDVVLDLQRNGVSQLVRWLLRPKAWSEFERFAPEMAGERTRRTIEAVGFAPLEVLPDLELVDPNAGLGLLRDAGWDGERDLVVLNPAGFFEDRAWPLESYADFARRWREASDSPTHFVMLGLAALEPKAAALRSSLGEDLLDLVGGTTAAAAFGVLSRARFVLSEDGGLMHMAWVAGTPTLALFGASRSVWARPHGNYSDCIDVCESPDGECMVAGACLGGAPTCLTRLTVERVLEEAQALLARTDGVRKSIYRDGA